MVLSERLFLNFCIFPPRSGYPFCLRLSASVGLPNEIFVAVISSGRLIQSLFACGETRLRVINYLVNPVDPVYSFSFYETESNSLFFLQVRSVKNLNLVCVFPCGSVAILTHFRQ